jgi:hypothetical protein
MVFKHIYEIFQLKRLYEWVTIIVLVFLTHHARTHSFSCSTICHGDVSSYDYGKTCKHGLSNCIRKCFTISLIVSCVLNLMIRFITFPFTDLGSQPTTKNQCNLVVHGMQCVLKVHHDQVVL